MFFASVILFTMDYTLFVMDYTLVMPFMMDYT